MKNVKRFLSLALTLLMLATSVSITAVSVSAVAPGPGVVFVKTGGDGNGISPDKPMGSLNSAMNSLLRDGGGTIVLVGPVEITSNIDMGLGDDYSTNLVFTSVYGGVDYRETAGAALIFASAWKNAEVHSPIEIENMDIITMGTNCSIYANGYPVVIGKGVNCKVEGVDSNLASNYLGVYGGSACDLSGTKNFPADTSLTVLSGTFFAIKAGGKGNAEKPRPSASGTLTIAKDVKVMGEIDFDFNEYGKVDGEKILINYDGINEAAKAIASKATKTYEVSGNGYVRGVNPEKVYIQADSGYAAEIDGELVKNGEYEPKTASLSVKFVKSDLNRADELSAMRPKIPSVFPGEYIKGYDNGDGTKSFKPAGNITIAEATTILVRLLTSEDEIKGKFTTEKAKDSDWYYHNVAYIDSFGAYDTFDSFDAGRQITRAEFVTLISAFKNLFAKTEEITFTDVAKEHKYYDAIKAGTMAKLVNGYDNGDGTFSFKPEAPITRAEVVTVINRVFDMADIVLIKYKDLEPDFSDVDLTHWAAYQIIAAAGGKEIEKPSQILGTGEVEHEAFGEVIFMMDTEKGDGSGKDFENAASYAKGHKMIKESGTFVVCGPITINSNIDFSLGNSGKVLFTSVYDGVDYRETNGAAFIFGSNWRNAVPRSETVFDNIAFVCNGSNCSIYCDNQKVTFGKDVVCSIEGGAALSIYAGSANDLSSCVNYLGSESTHVSHNGNYFGNLTIMSGTWGNVTGGGKGSNDKPRESDAAVVSISGNAKTGFVTGGSKSGAAKVGGMRVIILNNCENAIIEKENYEYIVTVKGDAEAEAVSISKDSVTIKITAANGAKVEGAAEDGTIVLEGEGSVVVTADANGVKAVKSSKDAAGTFDENVEYVTDEYLAELDAMQKKRTEEIFNTVSTIKPKDGCTAYYVSWSEGNDSNDGKSPETPWKTIEAVNKASYKPGDAVYFKRGDEWRNVSLSAKEGVSYSAYGEGEKPVLNRSPYDGAKHGTWTLVPGYDNIYVYSEKFANDIGTIAFNNRTFIDIYAQKICFAYNKEKQPVSGGNVIENPLAELKNDLDFWHDLKGPNVSYGAGGELYLRSNSGNPAERFNNIEFNQRGNAISIAGRGVTIDNITVRHAGSHGVGSGTTSNLTVTNCRFEWIGGSMQNYNTDFVRFGNAVEIYGGCDGYVVNNCFIDQVYDAGVTHQVSHETDGDFIMKNVTYSNNVILNCIYSIEHFNRGKTGTTRYLANITYKNNLCRLAGYGFGYTRPNKGAASHIRSGTIVDTANFVIENNIFDRSRDVLFLLASGGDEQIQWKNNVYIHRQGAKYGTMKGISVVYNSLITDMVGRYFAFPEVSGKYLFIKE